MVTMYVLRLLCDLSFYGYFAVFIAARFGCGGAFGGVALCAAAYGLSFLLRERKGLRRCCLLPLLLCGLYLRRGWADVLFLLPCMAYTFWLVWQGDYSLSRDRQQQTFGVVWKVFLLSAPFMLLAGNKAARAAVLPYALLTLVASVLLLRALRHEPAVYCRRSYQLCDMGVVAVTALSARVLSSETVLRMAGQTLKALYQTLIMPVLILLLRGLVGLLELLIRLLSFLKLRPPAQSGESILDNIALDLLPELEDFGEPSLLLRLLAQFLIVASAAVLLFLFFRWLGRRGAVGRGYAGQPVWTAAAAEEKRPGRRERGAVRSIRTRYKKHLRRLREHGGEIDRDSTSLDVRWESERFGAPEELSEAIRAIYVPARYAGKADKEQAAELKRLCDEAEKHL